VPPPAPEVPEPTAPATSPDGFAQLRQSLENMVRGAKQGLTGPAAQARTEAELQRREAEQKAQQQKLLESPHTPFETGSDAAIEDLQGRSLQLQSEAGDLEGQAARREAEAEAAAADDKQRELRNY